jgi:hypothetical protein
MGALAYIANAFGTIDTSAFGSDPAIAALVAAVVGVATKGVLMLKDKVR